jgi:hypothetical protein
VAIQTEAVTVTDSVTLVKDRRDRRTEERLVARMILNAVAEACGMDERLPLDLEQDEPVQRHETVAPPAWRDLLLERREAVCVAECGEVARVVFPGAFNPMHVGHRRMAELARERLGSEVHHEISIVNVDKPPMDYTEMEQRVEQFGEGRPVWLTRAATFEGKSSLFPGATFIVGVDTLRRIAAPKYYGHDVAARDEAIERIARRGCRFLVFNRDMGTGFVRLGDLDLPGALTALCEEVPPDQFREDISSTELRRRRRG